MNNLRATTNCVVKALALSLLAACAGAQDRVKGTAKITVGDDEYLIPIECNDARRPGRGVFTEPARITKERTGRSSGVRLTMRPWQDTDDVIITLDKYVAWVDAPLGSGGVWNVLKLDMSPASRVVNGVPTPLSYEDWKNRDRPEGLDDVTIRADCRSRDAEAPAYRKLTDTE